MTAAVTEVRTVSPWHRGEQALQARSGVAERMAEIGRRVIREHMPDQHRQFYAQLPFIVVGAVDARGRPWASVIEGQPGFLHSPDARRLDVDALPGEGDPVRAALVDGAPLGLLGIELHTRRRNRVNGQATGLHAGGLTLNVGESFGNCPQYIQARGFRFVRPPGSASGGAIEHLPTLDDEARATIAAADTFFVASHFPGDESRPTPSVDVSHRGGRPGFVKVEGDLLTIPDFAGNLFFNTLGNLLLNPRAGLVFLDFETGDVLQLSGHATLVFDAPELAAFQGAERLWTLRVERVVRRRDALALRWSRGEASPNSLMTGSWEAAQAQLRAAALGNAWRPFRVTRVEDESRSVRSFYLAPADGLAATRHEAGQHLPVRVTLPGEPQPLIRHYSLSNAPSDDGYRLSIQRSGKVSSHLHAQLKVGDLIEAKRPQGGFVIDAQAPRPAVLLAGGIGVTPLLAMLRHIVFEGERLRRVRPTYVVYATRQTAERGFDRELVELARRGAGAVGVWRVTSAPETGTQAGRDHEVEGRIDMDLLKAVLPFGDHDFYLCGPAGFMQSLYDGLRALRVADDRIHAEAFGPAALQRRPDAPVAAPVRPPAAGGEVPIVFQASGKAARWTPTSGPLLALAEQQGLSPEFSCRAGSCGSCKTRLVEGQVTYASEPAFATGPGEALLCCALPARGETRLVLDV